MTTIDRPTSPGITEPGKGRTLDTGFRVLVFVAGLLVLAILLAMLITTTSQSLPALQTSGLDFILSTRWAPNKDVFGVGAFVYGTVISSVIGLIIAIPISVGIALFLTELAPRWLRTPAVTVIDLLASVPSVVFGLVGIAVIAPGILPVYQGINNVFGDIPVIGALFGDTNSGRNFFTAGIILAVMVIPIITSISREVFDTVPVADKQAAYALGATRWEMIKGAVFPHSFGGLVGGSMLGLGRAMGETIAVSLVIGSSTQITANLFDSGNSMASVIAQQWGEAGPLHASALIGIGVLLFIMTVVVNFAARAIVRRAEVRMRGAAS
ncbi:phosphate ABC transporter permease subunit PstC [Stackebrandtia nassauensis]|uniref:Phosphate transport system permease protein n=1 Tax=Stackebrandtia nassauensis (strain DSM 44728 / CIP 108903 / NRRL B-16338 / NBRC 102104 / LLR-40K-21) TaxID=446470 RepID=D3Q240_STANL|nr:phosphate ABC transporter permease subunit PstC [Stackebrandtia nassauensis]ADD41907.1 phosphate ABC transporter, inner membrane subunit PstC [Stackebrandtia nassauensis DSM 44728]